MCQHSSQSFQFESIKTFIPQKNSRLRNEAPNHADPIAPIHRHIGLRPPIFHLVFEGLHRDFSQGNEAMNASTDFATQYKIKSAYLTVIGAASGWMATVFAFECRLAGRSNSMHQRERSLRCIEGLASRNYNSLIEVTFSVSPCTSPLTFTRR